MDMEKRLLSLNSQGSFRQAFAGRMYSCWKQARPGTVGTVGTDLGHHHHHHHENKIKKIFESFIYHHHHGSGSRSHWKFAGNLQRDRDRETETEMIKDSKILFYFPALALAPGLGFGLAGNLLEISNWKFAGLGLGLAGARAFEGL